jgi:predicted dehydrogenase
MYNVAVVGYRMQGSQHHAPGFARLEDCRIVGVCDVVAERAKEGADRFGVAAYTDVDEMLDREPVDIVNIPTSERFRYDLVMNALKRGKHVFTEKPLAGAEGQYRIGMQDLKPAREMVDEWQKHDVHFGVCFGLHASRNIRRAMDVIRSGELGPLKQVHARCFQGTWNHLIDMVRFLCGEVTEVFGYAGDDEAANKTACLRFESGAIGTVATSKHLNVQFQIKWVGEQGEVTIDNINGSAKWHLHTSKDATVWSQETDLRRGTYGSLFEDLIADYVDAIKQERTFEADGWAGLRHMEIDAAITESIRTGRAVQVERYRPEEGHTLATWPA